MRTEDIAKKVISGEMTLNIYGHQIREPIRDIRAWYNDTLAGANGAKDGYWNLRDGKSMEELNADMREHYQSNLDWEEELEHHIYQLPDAHCDGCGANLKWVLEEGAIGLRRDFLRENGRIDLIIRPKTYRCPATKVDTTKYMHKGKINVASPLIFANFFNHIDDQPKDEKHTPKYSLNSTLGRINIAKYKEKHNIAFGQMTNTSVGVYGHPDKKSIIIGNPYVLDNHLESLTDEDYVRYEKTNKKDRKVYEDKHAMIDGHILAGIICLSVWRWEATDKNTLGDFYTKIKKECKSSGFIELNVLHGTWNYEHYFDCDKEKSVKGDVYAKFTLKK